MRRASGGLLATVALTGAFYRMLTETLGGTHAELEAPGLSRGQPGMTRPETLYARQVMAAGSVIVRPAGLEEVAAAGALDRQVTSGHDRAPDLAAAQAEGRLLVAERHGEIVGYATHGKFFEYDFLELLVVRPSDRRTGVATALVAAVESSSRSGKLFTSTNQSNAPMQRLCAELGFESSGVVENLDEGDPELFFVKRFTT